jgi:hypothetical protein
VEAPSLTVEYARPSGWNATVSPWPSAGNGPAHGPIASASGTVNVVRL